jgi:hypothetical protein
MNEKIIELKKKLEESKIDFKEEIRDGSNYYSKITFQINSGRENNDCTFVYREDIIQQALECSFEKFLFIKGYEAIWSKELNTIEVGLSIITGSIRFFFNRLNKLINKPENFEEKDVEEEVIFIKLPSIDGLEISLGYASNEFLTLTNARERRMRNSNYEKVTLKIANSNKTTHDTTKEVLEKISNSIFFQIDLAFEIPIHLETQKESWIERRGKMMRKRLFVDKSASISEPKYEYDSEPISLYWYAKESSNMPIFQFLAFYQTVEFYFPIYSSFEAKQKIQSLIKDPRFNPNKDTDISKIISTIKLSSGGKSFGNEKDQLKATLNACTDNSELKEFFKADENRLNFYTENKGKNISKQKISIKNETTDFITEVTERIYEIRCRIVHSKASESEFDVLLPYSSEVKKLNFDIELIEFISRKVLITSSRPIKI